MRRFLAALLTLVTMGFLLWSGVRNSSSTSRVSPTPEPPPGAAVDTNTGAESPAEATVRGLLQDAGKGNVSGYLGAFSGPLKARLEREVGERGREAFGADLRGAAKSRKSHAVFAAEAEGGDSASVTVETVYPDRNERQTYRVEKVEGGWCVSGVETVKSHQPSAKFGAPANYVAPEGVPVQGMVRVETGDEPEKSAEKP